MENQKLLRTMEKCGHFLYHRRGIKRGQLQILKILFERENITQTELSKLLILKSGSVSETVKKLEDKGYIMRSKNEADKRQFILSLTDKGREFLQSQIDVWQMQENIMFEGLTFQEQKKLTELLEKLFADWEEKFDKSFFGHKKSTEKEDKANYDTV